MGILSSNATLDIKDSTDNGVIVLKPTAGDNSTATINRTQAGRTRIKVLQPMNYARVSSTDTLKISDVSLGKNSFLGLLIRASVPESLNNSISKLITSEQLIAAGADTGQPKLTVFISGRIGPNASQRGRVVAWTELVNGARGMANDASGGLFKLFGNVSSGQEFYGNFTMPRVGKDWLWVFIRRSTTTVTTSTYLSQGAIPFTYANTMSVGLGIHGTPFQATANLTAAGSNRPLGTNATDSLENLNNLNYILGGSTFDIARIVKIDASLNPLQAGMVMQGAFVEDITLSISEYSGATGYITGDRVNSGGTHYIALQPSTGVSVSDTAYWRVAEDFMINFDSLSAAGAKVSVNTGSYTSNSVADGPVLEIDAGDVTTTTNKTISNGRVVL